jgi:drug/metabolite transporter (DMT)-like permease
VGTPGRWRADLSLIGTAFLFGVTFVVVQEGVKDAEPFPFIAVRFLIGLLVLVPVARSRPRSPGVVRDGLVAGVALAGGYAFQTIGLQYTTPSVSAFITYLCVVFVPVLATVVFRRPPHLLTVVGVIIAVVGLVLLTGGVEGGFGRGEWLTVACALCFAIHILVLSRVAPRHDVVVLTVVQLATVTIGCGVIGFFTGGYAMGSTALLAALVTGIGATALAFLLQTSAQRVLGPTRVVLLLLLEPVFAAGLAALMGERLGVSGALGALLILLAVVVVEVGPVVMGRSRHPVVAEAGP